MAIKPLDDAPRGRQMVNHDQPAWRVGHEDGNSSLHGYRQRSESNRPPPARLIEGQCCERTGYHEAYSVCPMITESRVTISSLPRCDAGATSAIYSGTTTLAAPCLAPLTHRPVIMRATVEQSACMNSATMKRGSAYSRTRLRPTLSANTEA